MTTKKTVVLVVEDERPLINAITKKLEREGFEVVVARTADQAIGYLEDDDVEIHAVWLDHYLLGSGTGLDFLARVKAEDSRWKNVPVVVVSNTASDEKVHTYLALGATKYFTKVDHRLDDIVQVLTDMLKDGKT